MHRVIAAYYLVRALGRRFATDPAMVVTPIAQNLLRAASGRGFLTHAGPVGVSSRANSVSDRCRRSLAAAFLLLLAAPAGMTIPREQAAEASVGTVLFTTRINR